MPFMGPLLTIHGDIPIERGNAAEAMAKVLRLGKLWLSRGASVAIFPEGTRSKTGEINRFKAGAFSLAKEAGVEILPIVKEKGLKLAPESAEIDGGFRLKGTVSDKDLSYGALLAADRERYQAELAREIFK